MEALSGAASGIAVVSLAIQVLQSIGTIKTFIRDVKGASKELERLVDLLDRLCALLEDVRSTMERQMSLQGQHFPAPSMTIFNCLKSCEVSLATLQSVIDKYQRAQAGTLSTVKRWNDDVRFGFKKNDIVEFELRIQREIDYLHAAIGLNMTNIQLSAFSGLLHNQHTFMAVCSQLAQQPSSARSPIGSSTGQELSSSRKALRSNIVKRQIHGSASLECFGIYQRKFEHIARHTQNKTCGTEGAAEDVIATSHELILNWGFLKYGLKWVRRYPYGPIIASLESYPVVPNLWLDNCKLIANASISEIQTRFSLGAPHPFARDLEGKSLLHVAATWHRGDVCRLLIQYGLKPELSCSVESPLMRSIFNSRGSFEAAIDTIRVLLYGCDTPDDFGVADNCILYSQGLSVHIAEWVWTNAANVVDDSEMIHIKLLLLRNLICSICYLDNHDANLVYSTHDVVGLAVKLMDVDVTESYLKGEITLIDELFTFNTSSLTSAALGDHYIEFLTRVGLEVEACIKMELASLFEDSFHISYGDGLSRNFILERRDEDKLSLRWIRVLDPDSSGFILLSEHAALTCESGWYIRHWPFSETIHERLRNKNSQQIIAQLEARFDKCAANKARKERARTGQKRLKSKMPGAWTW